MISVLKRVSLTQWIFIFMVAGAAFGALAPEWALESKILSTVFLRMIKSIIVPIIMATLVIGIAGHGDDFKKVGRLAFRSFVYFEIVTTLALFIGLFFVNWFQPGKGVSLHVEGAHADVAQYAQTKVTFAGVIEHLVPKSFFEAAANNDVLQVVFFSILFAIALAQLPEGKSKAAVLSFFEGLAEVMFKFTGIVMKFAPIGIGAAIAVTVGHSGLAILKNLGYLVGTLYAALFAFAILVLLPVALIAKIPVIRFLKQIKDPAILAFSTTSSEAALPSAMERLQAFGVPKRIVSFVLPTGYSFNLDGTTLYLSMASVFVAQAAGVDLTFGQQLVMMLTLMVTSKGVAAVPRASLVILSGTLASFGLPLEGVAVIMGIDELMDMARTTVNLVGNCLAATVMARWEGELKIPEVDA